MGKRGGYYVYRDQAIEIGLLLKSVFRLAYQQTEGLLKDLFARLELKPETPSYTQDDVGQECQLLPHNISTLETGTSPIKIQIQNEPLAPGVSPIYAHQNDKDFGYLC